MTSRTGFADEKDSVLGELAVRMKKLSTDGYKQRRGDSQSKTLFRFSSQDFLLSTVV